MNEVDVLKQCTILDRKIVRLPAVQLDRTLYQQVAKRLQGIGGKWKGRPINGFIFGHDPTDLLADLQRGKVRNLKKEFQIFETPDHIAKQIVDLAAIEEHHRVLEPSAGRGAIIKHIPQCAELSVYELLPENRNVLFDLDRDITWGGADFLNAAAEPKYHRIVANPPFSKNQDIDHIRKMYELLEPGGRLVSMASTHWEISTNKKELAFNDWLGEVWADTYHLKGGEFKESGTNVPTVIVVIEKREIEISSVSDEGQL